MLETNPRGCLQANPRKRSFFFHGLRGATGNSHASFRRTKRRASRPRAPDPLGIAGSERHLRRSVDFGGSGARDADEERNRSGRLFGSPGSLAPSSQRTGRSRPRRNRLHARRRRRGEPSWFRQVRRSPKARAPRAQSEDRRRGAGHRPQGCRLQGIRNPEDRVVRRMRL